MQHVTPVHEPFVCLLSYPGDDYLARAEEARRALEAAQPEAAAPIGRFFEQVHGMSTEELQELFTRTFDLNPACVLEIGWQLFGDEYRRGEFLVKMRQLLAARAVPVSTEVPDHLTYALELLPRLKSDEAEALAANFVLPALAKMVAGLEGKANPYGDLLKAIRVTVAGRYVSSKQGVSHD